MALDREVISRRLKAGRWLAGSDRNGRGQLVALSVGDLAKLEPLAENRITASRIEEIEQERVDARPMELERIATALGLPTDWFEADLVLSPSERAALLARQLLAAAQALDPAGEREPPDEAERDR